MTLIGARKIKCNEQVKIARNLNNSLKRTKIAKRLINILEAGAAVHSEPGKPGRKSRTMRSRNPAHRVDLTRVTF